ncbi:bifunctional 3-deoxy-7-phosphoheptulonate synthase/chorismate mutase [Nodosilinea sp. LEGE 07088]|uniref:bifunctional 3-deoxy-7-phosphoheptulonate synthase/chorismate mutase n=1 Tax=Nodosilinea sp. LEGE 07088 TaxID=2777968 RepID=UPI00188042FB|nr:bifunctional 3-deoxy-7-phosphoheptulonate synthase/chorismate mutase [Nodosilinea sp. LEGE 07088]MBE9140966.1 bifunctional 3-deoxy-7-phosphoheptulonate synthase/chorismate mutase [Nodosilinea sp. LEGE 07088]
MKDASLVCKSNPDQRTVIALTDTVTVGGDTLLIVGGPCAVESAEQMDLVARHLAHTPVQALRGGVFKPRTSPYAFQGLGEVGLHILDDIRHRFQMPVISEVMAESQIEIMATHVDVLQVGSRNMQNFDLLKALGSVNKPVLLKRGLAATLEEFVMAAEYILSHGNPNVILCERGIRSFDTYTRNVLDLGAVVALKQITHLPVMVDPSHAAGKRELVPDLARAAIAAGADGLMVECHPVPDQSVSDARQALNLEEMAALAHSLGPMARALGRQLKDDLAIALTHA